MTSNQYLNLIPTCYDKKAQHSSSLQSIFSYQLLFQTTRDLPLTMENVDSISQIAGLDNFKPVYYSRKEGFTIVAFDKDDTDFAHKMARFFGWHQQMNLETELTGIYLLLRKR